MNQEVHHQVAGDAEQPTAERAPRRVVELSFNRTGNRLENLLDQIVGVGVLETSAASHALDEGAVDFRKLSPGPFIACVAQADQQAGTRVRRFIHPPGLPSIYNTGGKL